jgi:FlaA1/EpsC-like NDP-sugar epimerase
LRPGEKLYEELFHDLERLEKTSHEKILLARHREVDWDKLCAQFDAIKQSCDSADPQRLQALLSELVPENRFGPAQLS